MALCKSTMAMMILKKVVANAAEIISTLDDIQLKVCNAPRCLRSLMVNAKQVELGFPDQNLQVKSIFFVFDFFCLGFVYCFGALVLHAWGTVLYNVCKCEECR